MEKYKKGVKGKKLTILGVIAILVTIIIVAIAIFFKGFSYKDETKGMSAEDIELVTKVIDLAKEKEGLQYVWGGKGEIITEERLNELIGFYGESYYPLEKEKYIGNQGFDCSGLVYWSYLKVTGKAIGYSTTEQEEKLKDYKVSFKELQPGDLIFTPGHVVMYIGNGKVINSANKNIYPKGGVKIEGLGLNRFGTVYRPLDYIKALSDD